MRGVSQASSQTFLLIAFSMMPLASATAINFSAPLFATLASLVLLKEPVGPARWVALVIGFLGVLLVTHPGADTFQIGALFALGNAVLFGTVTAGVRGMTATEFAETLTMYQMVMLTAVFALILPFGFIMPTPADLPLMLAQRRRQRDRAILVDARAAPRADLGGRAVPISVAGLGDHPRLRGVGRRADASPADRLGDRGRLRPVPAVDRDAAARVTQ